MARELRRRGDAAQMDQLERAVGKVLDEFPDESEDVRIRRRRLLHSFVELASDLEASGPVRSTEAKADSLVITCANDGQWARSRCDWCRRSDASSRHRIAGGLCGDWSSGCQHCCPQYHHCQAP